jgi:predicted CXXCH cytochrome family protein
MRVARHRYIPIPNPCLNSAPNRARARAGVRVFLRALALLGCGLVSAVEAQTVADMVRTKHNLSVSGPGPIRALTETRICIFCHTPHNATPLSPLWNKALEPQAYTVYASPTLKAGPLPQPSGPTKLCLSCHDGTIAMGAVLNPAGGISMAGGDRLPPGSLSEFGLDLSGHHPVSFRYQDALPNAELAASLPPDLVFGGGGEVHCTTCHDPHNDGYGEFLLKDNRYSALCITCHQMTGWSTSAHATSTASVVGILPRPPKTWPTWTELSEWGCEVCHTPHFAPTAEELLNFTTAPPDPFSCTSAGCHSSEPAPIHPATVSAPVVGAARGYTAGMVDIARQIRKISAHHEPPPGTAPLSRRFGGAARSGIRSVTCADCHNPHLTSGVASEAPYVSGLLRGVSGIDRNGLEVRVATYQYEVCFKCHADNTPDQSYVPRVLLNTNTRLAFDPGNPSYHPVISIGRNLNIPSIPSPFEPNMTPSVAIYCTACHADDEGGSNGPHGSSFVPVLRERYEMADHTPESYDNYALCYRCHNRTSILSDISFQKNRAMRGGHSGHLADGAPCSACHDPHGVYDSGGAVPMGTGFHTHLINFDTSIVLPAQEQYPVFRDTGTFSGSCNLCCHDVLHDDSACGFSTARRAIGVARKAAAPPMVGVPPVAGAPLAAGPTSACSSSRVVCGIYP